MSARESARQRFTLGSVYMTRSAMAWLTDHDVRKSLVRHMDGDWGDVDAEDRASNDAALRQGTRLLSAYMSAGGVRFWIITEADRSSTTILLPSDY